MPAYRGECEVKIIELWHKKWSVWLLAVCVGLSEVAAYLPEVQNYLPSDWYRWAFIIVFIARMVVQNHGTAKEPA